MTFAGGRGDVRPGVQIGRLSVRRRMHVQGLPRPMRNGTGDRCFQRCADAYGDPTNTTDAFQLAKINDNLQLEDAERERQIAEIFAKHGVEVEFIN